MSKEFNNLRKETIIFLKFAFFKGSHFLSNYHYQVESHKTVFQSPIQVCLLHIRSHRPIELNFGDQTRCLSQSWFGHLQSSLNKTKLSECLENFLSVYVFAVVNNLKRKSLYMKFIILLTKPSIFSLQYLNFQ